MQALEMAYETNKWPKKHCEYRETGQCEKRREGVVWGLVPDEERGVGRGHYIC